jgi:hypothetical protein
MMKSHDATLHLLIIFEKASNKMWTIVKQFPKIVFQSIDKCRS